MPAHILISDRYTPGRQFLSMLLQGQGFQVSRVLSGTAALDLLQRERIDLIIANLAALEHGAIGFLEQVRTSAGQIPTILMTTDDLDVEWQILLRACGAKRSARAWYAHHATGIYGIVGLLVLPIDVPTLLLAIRRLLVDRQDGETAA